MWILCVKKVQSIHKRTTLNPTTLVASGVVARAIVPVVCRREVGVNDVCFFGTRRTRREACRNNLYLGLPVVRQCAVEGGVRDLQPTKSDSQK